MKFFTDRDLFLNGLQQLLSRDKIEIRYNTYGGHYDQRVISFLKENNYKQESSRSEGRDFECGVVVWVKKSQKEIDYENLDFQIKALEERFNVKITVNKLQV